MYIGAVAILGVASLAVRIFHTPQAVRTCPLCEAKVELGRQRCQVCGYRFFDRYGASGRSGR
jgi:predicted amidophosphoribosyltransferase